eukprot:GHVS01096312.1.p1 GENE.GHVS01096312.1~~GHVS01096312.1.p1  ORF type:complete len:808 (+),score=201.07 GHVS01096312.1:107-2530(+)
MGLRCADNSKATDVDIFLFFHLSLYNIFTISILRRMLSIFAFAAMRSPPPLPSCCCCVMSVLPSFAARSPSVSVIHPPCSSPTSSSSTSSSSFCLFSPSPSSSSFVFCTHPLVPPLRFFSQHSSSSALISSIPAVGRSSSSFSPSSSPSPPFLPCTTRTSSPSFTYHPRRIIPLSLTPFRRYTSCSPARLFSALSDHYTNAGRTNTTSTSRASSSSGDSGCLMSAVISPSSIPRPAHIPVAVWDKLGKGLHRNTKHPLGILKSNIEAFFLAPQQSTQGTTTTSTTTTSTSTTTLVENVAPSASSLSETAEQQNEQSATSSPSAPVEGVSWCLGITYSSTTATTTRPTVSKTNGYSEPGPEPTTILSDDARPTAGPTATTTRSNLNTASPPSPPHYAPRTNWLCLDNLSPIVLSEHNFDDLLITHDHPSRLASDTFYIDPSTQRQVIRTHCTAHQSQLLRRLHAEEHHKGAIWSGEVARRDEVDNLHYPVFHQLDGIRLWEKSEIAQLERLLREHGRQVFGTTTAAAHGNGGATDGGSATTAAANGNGETTSSTFLSANNPYKDNVVVLHLQRTLEQLIAHLLGDGLAALPLRWDHSASFPFTQPSLELELFHRGRWIEVLGCGQIHPKIMQRSGLSGRRSYMEDVEEDGHVEWRGSEGMKEGEVTGWAFGMGLERLAMLLYDIPDIRFFWTDDQRFWRQFEDGRLQGKTFAVYGRNPAIYKDIAFWLPKDRKGGWSVNEFFEGCREVIGELLESVELVDMYSRHGRDSVCYRIGYRALGDNLTHDAVNELQLKLIEYSKKQMGLDVR